MRIVIDYRPALRARTGVGEYIHHVAGALAGPGTDDVTIFSSSWKDRLAPASSELSRAHTIDRRVPVSWLNFAWHRLEWPPIESIAGGRYDVAHSPHPLLLPSRTAASVITIHDLHFLMHPERTAQEIRRDYPALVSSHARRADRIIVSSQFAAGEVHQHLAVPTDKIAVCPAGAPTWQTGPAAASESGYILFLGTLEARKNIGGLLDAFGRLLARVERAPRLVLAGRTGPDAGPWLEAIGKPPLAGHVEYAGYVPAERREQILKGAQMFVLPSFEEGFGLTALEAMSAGVPVVASSRGSLPEVVGDAGLLIDPDDVESLVTAMTTLARDGALRAVCAERGLDRAKQFSWDRTARDVRRAYEEAIACRSARVNPSRARARDLGANLDAHRD